MHCAQHFQNTCETLRRFPSNWRTGPMGKQLQHNPPPGGGEPCRRCGLRYSPETAYVRCFKKGDTFETWLARQHPKIQKLVKTTGAGGC